MKARYVAYKTVKGDTKMMYFSNKQNLISYIMYMTRRNIKVSWRELDTSL